jgi:uncharacterized protein (DUF362 family)
MGSFEGKSVALKANFNSADPFPASTHLDTLAALVSGLKDSGTRRIVLAERSGMGNTKDVLDRMGVISLSQKLGFDVVVLDSEKAERWQKVERGDTHWLRGFYLSKAFLEADKVVQTCCLKTHRFGGHFTLSLKNSVGLVAKRVPGVIYDYMWELHATPNQRLKIAEINAHYKVDLIVMDGIKAFVSDGPEKGKTVEPGLILASSDRIAIDAVGVAILRMSGATKEVTSGRIFELEQISRASELGVGARSPADVKLVPLNSGAEAEAPAINEILSKK